VKRWGILVLAIVLAACGDRARPGEEETFYVEEDREEDVAPLPTEVFLREPAVEIGPGRRTIHVMIVTTQNATAEQIRRTLLDAIDAETAADAELIALRAVAYLPRATSPGEAELVPIAWGEWLPPGGWEDTTARRERFQRTHTYIGTSPPW
jgi:hypothetical protein